MCHHLSIFVIGFALLGFFALQCQSLIFPSFVRQPRISQRLNVHQTSVEPQGPRSSFLSFSTEAIQKMKTISDSQCFRVGIVDGGCSGMSYVVEPVSIAAKGADDKLEVHSGISCLIDPFSLTYIEGINIGYRETADPEHTGFTFENPNASSSW